MSSSNMSIPDSFGMPDFSTHSPASGNLSHIESSKELYERRKNFLKQDIVNNDILEYPVEHLIDHEVDRKAGIATIDDCIRNMQLQDARGRIWSQEMLLRVSSRSVKFVDVNGEELENFPIQMIQQVKPVVLTEKDKSNFKNLCGIIVKHPDLKVPNIHLFHCLTIPPYIISSDINCAIADSKSKKARKSRPETIRKNHEELAKIYAENVDVNERIREWDRLGKSKKSQKPTMSPRSSIFPQEETPQHQAYRINREVMILNHTLDDIEHFAATIKRACEAARELTNRRSVKKSKKSRKESKEHGMGILQLRSRLPSLEAYKECYQKFKYCLNYMCKLKQYLESPNSVELVHYLFHPLEYILSSCENKDAASTVTSPFLLPETIEFLSNCCTSREIQILTDLGKYWNTPRSEFQNAFFPPYYHRFRGGWRPPPQLPNDIEPQELNEYISDQHNVANQEELQRQEKNKRGSAEINGMYPPPSQERSRSGTTSPEAYKDFVTKHINRNKEANGMMSYQTPPNSQRKLCRAMHSFEARSKYELSVERDDLLDLLDDSQSWWKVRNNYGHEGLVPGDLMLLISSANPPQPQERPSSPPIIPYTVTENSPIPPPPPPILVQPKQPTQPKIQPIDIKTARPLKPTPKPYMGKPSDTSKRNREYLQEELQERVKAQNKRSFIIPPKHVRSNSIQLSGDSSPKEVTQWLISHNFSDLTIQSLGALNGSQLFSLTKQDLIKVCDREASRVFSQLLVQSAGSKNSSQASELDEIMRRRRNELISQDPIKW